MKELNPDINLDTTIVVEKQVKTERVIHILKPHKGHTVYEFDLSEQVMRVATIDEVTSDFKGGVRELPTHAKGDGMGFGFHGLMLLYRSLI